MNTTTNGFDTRLSAFTNKPCVVEILLKDNQMSDIGIGKILLNENHWFTISFQSLLHLVSNKNGENGEKNRDGFKVKGMSENIIMTFRLLDARFLEEWQEIRTDQGTLLVSSKKNWKDETEALIKYQKRIRTLL
ncbi:MAG: hypothetical protein KGJ35_02600 [Patescibacteria group bacterium]|nr:hypothetical protein [Patescibacteria group bacterium]